MYVLNVILLQYSFGEKIWTCSFKNFFIVIQCISTYLELNIFVCEHENTIFELLYTMKMQGICMYKYVSKFQIYYIRGHAHTQHIQFLYSNICKSNNFEVFALRKLENCCPKRLQSVSPPSLRQKAAEGGGGGAGCALVPGQSGLHKYRYCFIRPQPLKPSNP